MGSPDAGGAADEEGAADCDAAGDSAAGEPEADGEPLADGEPEAEGEPDAAGEPEADGNPDADGEPDAPAEGPTEGGGVAGVHSGPVFDPHAATANAIRPLRSTRSTAGGLVIKVRRQCHTTANKSCENGVQRHFGGAILHRTGRNVPVTLTTEDCGSQNRPSG